MERLNVQHILEKNIVRSDAIKLLYKEYDESLDMLKDMESSDQMEDELHIKESKTLIKRQIEKLEEINLPIVVAGEVKGGKSTVLNLLIGDELLPTSVLECTAIICVIHNSNSKGFVVKNMDTGTIICEEKNVDTKTKSEDFRKMLKKYVVYQKGKKTENIIIDINWPIPFLKGNTVLVDTPGAGDNPEIISRVKDYLKNALVFVFVINTPNAGGFQADRVKKLFELSNPYETPFDPRTAIFICNKWQDVKNAQEEDTVLEYIKSKLKQWPSFDPEKDLFILDAKDEMELKTKNLEFTDNFKSVLAKINEIITGGLDMKSMLHITALSYHLQQFYTHVNVRIRTSFMSPEKKTKKIEEVRQSIAKLESKKNEIVMKYQEKAQKLWIDLSYEINKELTKKETKEYLTNWKGFYLADTWAGEELKQMAEKNILKKFERLQGEWTKNIIDDKVKKLVDECKKETGEICETTEFAAILECSIDCSLRKREILPFVLRLFNFVLKPFLFPIPSMLERIFAGVGNKIITTKYKSNKEKFMSDHALFVLNQLSTKDTERFIHTYFLDPFYNFLEHFSGQVKQINQSKKILISNIKDDNRSYSDIVKQFAPVKSCLEKMIGGLTFIIIKFGYSKLVIKQTSLVYSNKESVLFEGTYASVYNGTFYGKQNHNVAVKILKTPLEPKTYFEQLVEIEKLGQVEHDNIVTLFGIFLTEKNGLHHLQLIIELCEMSLEEMIFKNKSLNPCADVSSNADLKKSQEFTIFKAYCQDIFKGLIFIHKSNIIHKNLKISNVMITNKGAKITDFWTYTKDINGTPTHVAPELFTDDVYGPETDVYSLGILLWEFWFGCKVFEYFDLNSVKHVISFFKEQNRRPYTDLPGKISPHSWLKEIIVACWDLKQSKRPHLESILESFQNSN